MRAWQASILDKFSGGISDFNNRGIEGSFKFGKNLDIRKVALNLLKNIRYNKEELERELPEYVNEQYKQGKITKDLQEALLRGNEQETAQITERGGGREKSKTKTEPKPTETGVDVLLRTGRRKLFKCFGCELF